MNDVEAARQLQTIRTLMERAALYRRALGPMLLTAGSIGIAGSVLGWLLSADTVASFLTLWLIAAGAAMTSSFLLVRREAIRAKEAFWTPPTRRVAAAMSLPLFAGVLGTIALVLLRIGQHSLAPLLPYLWAAFYGLALHAAGFFTLRGIRQLGVGFVIAGGLFGLSSALTMLMPGYQTSFLGAHMQMGGLFGVLHLVAGGKLMVEERHSLT
jgi:hypothetical protein